MDWGDGEEGVEGLDVLGAGVVDRWEDGGALGPLGRQLTPCLCYSRLRSSESEV